MARVMEEGIWRRSRLHRERLGRRTEFLLREVLRGIHPEVKSCKSGYVSKAGQISEGLAVPGTSGGILFRRERGC